MLTADTAHKTRSLAAACIDSVLDKLADTLDINSLERIGIENLVSEIISHEGPHIVTAEAEGHLGKVVGTEAEELGSAGHTVSSKGCTRNLDHGTEVVVDGHMELSLNLETNLLAVCLLELELAC